MSLKRVDGMTKTPDLLLIALDPGTGEVAAFEELIGSHGGLGGPQTEPFILHPSEWHIDEPIIGAENVYRQIRRWLSGMGIELGAAGKPAAPSTGTQDQPSPTDAPTEPVPPEIQQLSGPMTLRVASVWPAAFLNSTVILIRNATSSFFVKSWRRSVMWK